MYKILSIAENAVRLFQTKEELLKYVKHHQLCYYGHNPNDTLTCFSFGRFSALADGYFRQRVEYIIYDDFGRVVDLPTLKEELDRFTWPKRFTPVKRARYRIDPVPRTGKRHWSSYYRTCCRKGKSEYTALALDPAGVRLKFLSAKKRLVCSWADDHPRSYSGSWKDRSKNKKQWMFKNNRSCL